MRPLPFVWPYALIFWLIYIWTFFPEYKIIKAAQKNAQRADTKDQGSLKVLLSVQWIALMVAYPLAFIYALQFPVVMFLPLFVVGELAIIGGSVLRRMCWRALGEFFTGDVQARNDQPVVCTGPYKFVRHPSYTGGMMMFIGIGLALGSWASLVILTVSTIAAYGYRVFVEERALLATIGEPYREYSRERRRFIPYVV